MGSPSDEELDSAIKKVRQVARDELEAKIPVKNPVKFKNPHKYFLSIFSKCGLTPPPDLQSTFYAKIRFLKG